MSDHQFTFPPPPPAPPKASQSYPGVPQPFGGSNGYRSRGNRGDHGNRGHGRGLNPVGPRDGPFSSSPRYGNSSLGVDNRHSSPPDNGHNVQMKDHRRNGYPLPSYPPVQLPRYPTSLHQDYGQQNPPFPAMVRPARPPQVAYSANRNGSPQIYNGQQHYSSHGCGPSPPTIHTPLPPAQNNNSFQINAHAGQPVLMGPPIRMGFEIQQNGHQTQQYTQPVANGTSAYPYALSSGNGSPYRHSSPMGFPSGRHEPPNSFPGHRGRGQKRGHGEAFNRPRNQNQQNQVAPAVPSFGSPLALPIKPPPLHENVRKPRKKKRKHNQLGLTPKAEEHESSEEEEDDADEEARLAAVAASAGQGSQL